MKKILISIPFIILVTLTSKATIFSNDIIRQSNIPNENSPVADTANVISDKTIIDNTITCKTSIVNNESTQLTIKDDKDNLNNIENPNNSSNKKPSGKLNKKESSKKPTMPKPKPNKVEKEFIVTFYTSLAVENGGYTGLNSQGNKLKYGQVASNYYPYETKINLVGYGNMVVSDRGGKDFNSSNRLDIFIPQNKGETSSQYLKRVNAMGRKKIKGYVYK